MKRLIILLLLTIPIGGYSQTAADLEAKYLNYKENSITHRRFKHAQIQEIVTSLPKTFEVSEVGKSVSGKSINLVKYGNGPVSVFMWSQMHGNEPTATMALMDVFKFLVAENDGFDELRSSISEKLSVYFIPMLNPDGADLYQRRNLYGIDINRDALRLQTPEGRILKKVRDSIDADWGFNLHDQGRYTGAGMSKNPATLSFLAPAYNFEKEVNENRGDAMRLISQINEVAQQYIPDQVGKYPDDFEPRAFGDNIQKWGTRTILIESGGNRNDREKQDIRKFNFVIFLLSLESIANGDYKNYSMEGYENLPFNSYRLHETILRNVTLADQKGNDYITDIAYRVSENEDSNHEKFTLSGYISDLGDLSTSIAYKEMDCEGYSVEKGKLYFKEFETIKDFKSSNIEDLIKQGYTEFIVKEPKSNEDWYDQNFPVSILHSVTNANSIGLGSNYSFVIKSEGEVIAAVINGLLFDLN